VPSSTALLTDHQLQGQAQCVCTQELPSAHGSCASEPEPAQRAASEWGSVGVSEAVGASPPASVADIEEGAALAAAAADAPAAQSPGRVASITLGQLARESSDQLPPVAMAGRAHSVPAQQVPLPPSLRKLAPLQTSSVWSSGTFSRHDFRHS
jgi:hypothetical protein